MIGFEYLRCSEISGEIHSRVQRKLVKKDVAKEVLAEAIGREGVTYRDWETDRKSTRLNSSHITRSRMPSSA